MPALEVTAPGTAARGFQPRFVFPAKILEISIAWNEDAAVSRTAGPGGATHNLPNPSPVLVRSQTRISRPKLSVQPKLPGDTNDDKTMRAVGCRGLAPAHRSFAVSAK